MTVKNTLMFSRHGFSLLCLYSGTFFPFLIQSVRLAFNHKAPMHFLCFSLSSVWERASLLSTPNTQRHFSIIYPMSFELLSDGGHNLAAVTALRRGLKHDILAECMAMLRVGCFLQISFLWGTTVPSQPPLTCEQALPTVSLHDSAGLSASTRQRVYNFSRHAFLQTPIFQRLLSYITVAKTWVYEITPQRIRSWMGHLKISLFPAKKCKERVMGHINVAILAGK